MKFFRSNQSENRFRVVKKGEGGLPTQTRRLLAPPTHVRTMAAAAVSAAQSPFRWDMATTAAMVQLKAERAAAIKLHHSKDRRGHEGVSKKNFRTYSKFFRDVAPCEVLPVPVPAAQVPPFSARIDIETR
jgi:hypothetical protein